MVAIRPLKQTAFAEAANPAGIEEGVSIKARDQFQALFPPS